VEQMFWEEFRNMERDFWARDAKETHKAEKEH
jgi:hypothetical protein